MRALARSALWWLALFGLWVVMQGTNEKMELAAGAGAAALGALVAEALSRQDLIRFAPDAASVATAAKIPWQATREFAILAYALLLHVARIRPLRSAWRAVPFAAVETDARSTGARAIRPLIDNVTPNTIVADVDCERGVALKHDLVPGRASDTVP